MTAHSPSQRASRRTGTVARCLLALGRVGCCVGLLLTASYTHAALPQRFFHSLQTEPIQGLLGAGVGDIVWSGRYLWVATESGVARLDPSQNSGMDEADWVTYTELNGIGRGGLSALDTAGDTVWVATVYDTIIADLGNFNVGAGLSFSPDAGLTWQNLPSETIFDTTKPEFAKGPATPIDNPCWGLSLDGHTIWGALFSGSSGRSQDGGLTWERRLPDGADEIIFFADETSLARDSLAVQADSLELTGGPADQVAFLREQADSLDSQHLMHRTFSVLAYGDTVWIGTSSGIGRSFDNGRTWKNLKVRFDTSGQILPGHIGGNWVVALERQFLADGSTVIWAGTRSTGKAGEINSISFSRDNGATWTITGPTYAWDFAFTANKVWAGTDQGLFSSPHQGQTWQRIEVEDTFTQKKLRGTFVGLETVGEILWVGAENGLASSTDEGVSWHVTGESPLVDTTPPQKVFEVLSILDVPNDQGRQVRITWSKYPDDSFGADTLITEYSVWRKIDPNLPTIAAKMVADSTGTPVGRWDFLTKVTANQSNEYNVIAPTLADSTINRGVYYSTFFVQAHAAFPNIHYSTAPDSGYSVDNLEPQTPAGFAFTTTADVKAWLTWEQVPDKDFAHYALFRGSTMSFVPDAAFYTTIDTEFKTTIDEEERFYRIAALDFAGNSSPLSKSLEVALDTHVNEAFVRQTGQPQAFALLPNYPNPFNSNTVIRFTLPTSAPIELALYNLTGQKVATLVEGMREAGTYTVRWDGRDAQGRALASGVYLYRLRTDQGRVETRKLVLLR